MILNSLNNIINGKMTDKIKIAKIQRNNEEVRLIITPNDLVLIISDEILFKLKLVEDVILTPSQLDHLVTESEFFKCDRESARILANRQHSKYELIDKLNQKDFSPESISRVISKFKDRGLLDDTKHAFQLANKLIERKPCGKPYLVSYLLGKKIPRNMAEQVARALYSSLSISELAISSLEKRWDSIKTYELETARKKAYNYLSGRGFDYGSSKEAFDDLMEKTLLKKTNEEIEN